MSSSDRQRPETLRGSEIPDTFPEAPFERPIGLISLPDETRQGFKSLLATEKQMRADLAARVVDAMELLTKRDASLEAVLPKDVQP
jgi:hypothetical protein